MVWLDIMRIINDWSQVEIQWWIFIYSMEYLIKNSKDCKSQPFWPLILASFLNDQFISITYFLEGVLQMFLMGHTYLPIIKNCLLNEFLLRHFHMKFLYDPEILKNISSKNGKMTFWELLLRILPFWHRIIKSNSVWLLLH